MPWAATLSILILRPKMTNLNKISGQCSSIRVQECVFLIFSQYNGPNFDDWGHETGPYRTSKVKHGEKVLNVSENPSTNSPVHVSSEAIPTSSTSNYRVFQCCPSAKALARHALWRQMKSPSLWGNKKLASGVNSTWIEQVEEGLFLPSGVISNWQQE